MKQIQMAFKRNMCLRVASWLRKLKLLQILKAVVKLVAGRAKIQKSLLMLRKSLRELPLRVQRDKLRLERVERNRRACTNYYPV